MVVLLQPVHGLSTILVVLPRPVPGRSSILVDAARILPSTPVQQVGPSFPPSPLPPPQQSSPSTPWFRVWESQSLTGCFSSTVPAPPTPVTDWVADSGATNHTTPHLGHIYSPRPPSFAQPSSIVVGNGSVLPIISVSDSVLPGPFYLNDGLLAPGLVQSLLYVRCFTTDNSCSIEFDLFSLSVKDPFTRRVLARYDSTGLLYTLPRPSLPHVLSHTPWLLPLPPPPGIIALVTPTLMSSPSYRVAQPSPVLRVEMIPCVMPANLVSTSGCPFLPPILESFDPLTSPVLSVSGYKYYLIILDDCTHYSWTFPLRQKFDTFPTLSHFLPFVST
jgi:hypothetical protein